VSRVARAALLWTAAAAVLVSGWVHLYLYFRGGYRGIAPESLGGLTISRSFALNALAAVVIAELLAVATRIERLVVPATVAGALFAVGTLAAYTASRTTGLLGFEESLTTTEAVVALVAETTALLCCLVILADAVGRRVASARVPSPIA
jgi:hypothetical protein